MFASRVAQNDVCVGLAGNKTNDFYKIFTLA